MIRKRYAIESVGEGDFAEMCWRLLDRTAVKNGTDTVVRLVFFGDPVDSAEYAAQLEKINTAVAERFGQRRPALTYVAQGPPGGGLTMEVTAVESNADVKYGDGNWLVISGGDGRELVTGGIRAADPGRDVAVQAELVFGELERILKRESFPVDSIVRQWNYMEGITRLDGDRQRYQEFNDARSRFYARADWRNGYPAATGIGTRAGGIIVEVNALLPGEGVLNTPLDNTLQVAAHSYSQRVLAGTSGREQKSTPKFERARLVGRPDDAVVYVSGTAAIRGEESIAGSDATEQTRVTMENIEWLCHSRGRKFHMFRVYVKNPEYLGAVKRYMESLYADTPACYLSADVCRSELLVEIEGVAGI